MNQFDLRSLRVITGHDLAGAAKGEGGEVLVREDAILTTTAREAIQRAGLTVRTVANGQAAEQPARPGVQSARTARRAWSSPEAAFRSPEALRIKQEMVVVGRKLWERQYVDGNGGNLSCRLTDDWVVCTPTLMSKADLTVDDMCLVDLDGNQLTGVRNRSSEIFLHLEILKAVPEANAVVHCHPPHATAYAVAGLVPPTCLISEHEIFVGPVALVPYETPGTMEAARAVLPYCKDHNTMLMANHGVVCWADTVTHAEWYVEVLDTTCRILILTSHLGVPPRQIPREKIGDLLTIKQRMGMPDARLGDGECEVCDRLAGPAGISVPPVYRHGTPATAALTDADRDALVRAIADRVLAALREDRR